MVKDLHEYAYLSIPEMSFPSGAINSIPNNFRDEGGDVGLAQLGDHMPFTDAGAGCYEACPHLRDGGVIAVMATLGGNEQAFEGVLLDEGTGSLLAIGALAMAPLKTRPGTAARASMAAESAPIWSSFFPVDDAEEFTFVRRQLI